MWLAIVGRVTTPAAGLEADTRDHTEPELTTENQPILGVELDVSIVLTAAIQGEKN